MISYPFGNPKKQRNIIMAQTPMQEIRRKLPLRSKNTPTPADDDCNTEFPSQSNAIYQLPIEDIIPNPSQPRAIFQQNAILRLSDSIRRYGILQPLTVRKVLLPAHSKYADSVNLARIPANVSGESTYLPPDPSPVGFSRDHLQKNPPDSGDMPVIVYELVAGERRLRAAKLAGFTHVPCLIINTDDSTSAELAIIENLLREDLNMFEQAEAFRRLIDEFMLTQEEVARRVSLSQSAVANKLRILRLSRTERDLILQAGLTERHARALLKINDECTRINALRHVIERKFNVSATEAYIDELLFKLSRIKLANSTKYTPQNDTITETPVIAVDKPYLEGGAIRKYAIRDVKLFYNSIKNAAVLLEQAGSRVNIEQSESDEAITITVKILAPSK
jgi:ParB family chromosome partitioning protein